MLLSIDPGDKRVGLARWTETGKLEFNETLSFEDYLQYLLTLDDLFFNGFSDEFAPEFTPLTKVIVEDWRLRQGKGVKMTGSQFLSAQCIGAAKLFAKMYGAKVILQSPQILHVAAMHFGVKVPLKGHIPDDVSAKLHGLYYFEEHGILEGHGADMLDYDS